MESDISDIENVGKTSIEIFNSAGLFKIKDIFVDADQSRRIQDVLQRMKALPENELMPDSYWFSLGTRLTTIIEQVRSAYATPFIPDHFQCIFTGTWFNDPVVTKYGHTYERAFIESYIDSGGKDPYTRLPLTKQELVTNFALLHAMLDYKKNFLRYAIPLKINR